MTAKRERQAQFINLRQWDRSVETYTAEFTRLSRFAPQMVADEADKADRFQQGLHWNVLEKLVSRQLRTYEEVLTAALSVESSLIRRNKNRGQNKQCKKPFQQGGNQKGNQQAKRPNQNQNRREQSTMFVITAIR